jgi:hypothetical protein
MKIAFTSELPLRGKLPENHPNMRTEFAWINALDADHYPLPMSEHIENYDHVFIIFPKGQLNLNAVGAKIADTVNPTSRLLSSNWLSSIKSKNKKVYFVQEGPHWIYTELEIADQIYFYNMLASVDAIFAHNESDVNYYKGLVPNKPVHTIPTLMVEDLIKDLEWKPEEKVIIGGNFARWYGGFESFIVAQEVNVPVWGQTSHATRENENQLVQHLPRVDWLYWMRQLSTFKYAVHLMPTVAAGTFALNCAYLGIPCIGNKDVDTQIKCHPDLSVSVADVRSARQLATKLKDDKAFYEECSKYAKANYKMQYSLEVWKQKMNFILNAI